MRLLLPCLLLAIVAIPSYAEDAPKPAPAEAKKPADAPKTKVVSNGAEPRRVIRYALKKGTKQYTKLDTEISVTVSGMAQPVPSQAMMMGIEVADRAENGDATIVSTFGEIKMRGAVNPAVQAAMDQLKGAKLKAVVDGRGKAKSIAIEGDLQPQLQMILENMKRTIRESYMEFPAEKLGVGATWTRSRRIEANGLKIDATDQFKITAMQGNVITIEVKGTQTAPKQKFQPPGAPMQLDLTALAGKSAGTTTIDLTQPSPLKANVDVKVDMKMDAGMGEMEIVNKTKVVIGPFVPKATTPTEK